MWILLGIGRVAAQCVLQGNCGPASRFGADLPCVNYTDPITLLPSAERDLLTAMCGAALATNPVCCSPEQVYELSDNLKRVEPLLGSCPACEQNFFDVFCQFTCSPHQRDFVEIVRNRTTLSGHDAPAELNYYIDDVLAERVYNSCSEVKFSATNGRALDLVGGGATNHEDFFKFLGDEKPMLGGSAFQINFPWGGDHQKQNDSPGYSCGVGDRKCSCIDCEASCPEIEIDAPETCHLGPFRCVSLGLVCGYFAVLCACALLWQKVRHKQRRQSVLEIQRLLEDDEHDEDDPFSLPSSELGSLQLRSYALDAQVSGWLRRQGRFCAHYPWLVVTVCCLFVLCASLGIAWMELESDPVNLWVDPASREASERLFFNDAFDGGFYRTAQLFVVNETGPVLQSYDTLEWLKSVEQRAQHIRTPVLLDTLDSFCLKPVGDACVVESVTAYGVRNTATWRTRLEQCTKQPVNCLPTFQQPIDPHIVFGATDNSTKFIDSNALVTTWVLRNSEDQIYLHRVTDWEIEFETFLRTNVTREAHERGLRVSFNVESSLERELQRSGQTDAKIVVLSYLAMFAYVALTLGDSVWLGLVGIAVVIASVTSAIGLLSLAGLRLTLITTEVIPFLALAIGVDNIFLIVHQLSLVSQVNPTLLTLEDQVAAAVGSIGPSIVMSTSCEIAALAIATAVAMPAVRSFAVFACVAVLVNSALQLTLFVALLVIHKGSRRLRVPTRQPRGGEPLTGQVSPHEETQADPRRFSFVISSYYTPFLLGRKVKQVVITFFVLWLAISLYFLPRIELGLDQRLAVPKDSFMVSYFSDVYDLLDVGPPTYFVVKFNADERAEARDTQQRMCSRFSTCMTDSLVNILEMERKVPEASWLTSAPASWIDDFFMWLNPALDTCCVEDSHVCYADRPWSFDMTGFPEGYEFTHYLNKWLSQRSDKCPLAGKAPYSEAISREGDVYFSTPHLSIDYPTGEIRAAYFRTNHVPLRSQADYIAAYGASRQIMGHIEERTGLDVFAYSVFYPFFAQYLTIVPDTLLLTGEAIGLSWVLSWVLLGNFKTSVLVAVVITSLVVDVCGLMYALGISLNALSLVNLVICVGLAVEFCIHIVRSFTFVPRVRAIGIRGFTKVDRAYNALAGTGGTVFGGVAVTKLIGVCVLALAHSQIFNVYYFRMWLALIVTASLHAMVLLPVVLSEWGGSAWLLDDESPGLVDLEEL